MNAKPFPPIHIFRAGRHTDMSGRALEFTADDLKASAAAYDPAKWAAPLVAGHPTHDAPAYGEVSRLVAAGTDLEAEPVNVDPAFAELVNARRFKSVSASFYLPDSPSNPVPGVYYLRHVGFLGAQPPALKGLRPVQFADAEEGVVSFADFRPGLIAGLFAGLRELVIEKFGREEADKTLPTYTIEAVRDWAEEEGEETGETPPTQYSEDKSMSDADKARLAELEAENKCLKESAAAVQRESQAKAAKAAAAAFCESLADTKGSKLTAAQRKLAEPLLARLDAEAEPLSFGEGETKTAAAALKDLLASLPVQVQFGEFAKDGATGETPTDPTLIAAEAASYMEKHPGVKSHDAVQIVMAGKHKGQ